MYDQPTIFFGSLFLSIFLVILIGFLWKILKTFALCKEIQVNFGNVQASFNKSNPLFYILPIFLSVRSRVSTTFMLQYHLEDSLEDSIRLFDQKLIE